LLVGQHFSETVFWQSSENTARLVDKAVDDAAEGKHSNLLVDFRISAEEKLPVELNVQLLADDTGAAQIFVCGRALPENERALGKEIQNELLLRTAESAGIGLWFWDIEDSRIYSTPSCNELLGLPGYDPVTFESFLTVVHPDDRSYVQTLFERLQAQSIKYEDEFRVVRSDGTVDWIAAEGKSISDGGETPNRMMGIVRKVTEQRMAADELAKVYDREKRARDEAVEANRSKDFFLAFVSHELRSPLNAILGWSKILLTKKVDDDTRKNALETIERSARLQTKLINDLVDSARVASGKLRLEFHPTNLCEIVRVAYQAQKPTADAHSIEFAFDSDCDEIVVFGDAGRLQQVLTNLISNAIKYAAGQPVDVIVSRDGPMAVVEVRDKGPGIPEDQLPRIFERFERAASTRHYGGMGLGLYVARQIAQAHGGTIVGANLPDGGVRFTVRLPVVPPALQTPQ
jgi:hypothetical protein